METKLDKGDYSDYSSASKVTLGDLFKRYINEEKHKKKKQWKNEEYRLRQLLDEEISNVNLNQPFDPLDLQIYHGLSNVVINVSARLIGCSLAPGENGFFQGPGNYLKYQSRKQKSGFGRGKSTNVAKPFKINTI